MIYGGWETDTFRNRRWITVSEARRSPVKSILFALLAILGLVVIEARAGQAVLTWSPPLTNTDGTALSLTGFRIYHGPTATSLTEVVTLTSPGLTRYVVDNLPAGPRFFAMTALSATSESDPTAPVSTNVAADPPPPSQLLSSGSLAYELRTASSTVSMVAIGVIPAGQPCGPEVQTVTNVKYCRIQRGQIDVVNWPVDLKLQSVWAKASP